VSVWVVLGGCSQPQAVEPVSVEPVSVEPVSVEPVAVEPVAVEPAAPEPVVSSAAPECETQSDCGFCGFAEPFVTEADCTCWHCPSIPMSGARCEAIAASHRAICGAWAQTHACAEPRDCDTMSIPNCKESTCGETRIHFDE
jgi:hypothetical protein